MDKNLYEAAAAGDVEALNEVIRVKNKEVLKQVTPRGNTALHIASKAGHADFVSKLLSFAPWILAEVNYRKDTALHEAARNGHAEVVALLLEQDEHQLSRDDQESLLCRLESGTGIHKLKNDEKNTALHEAAKGGHLRVVEILFKQDDDLACELNAAGESPIFKASEEGHLDVFKKLFRDSPSLHVSRFDGRTLLHAAVLRGHTYVAAMLLDEQPELAREADKFGSTPLHLAASAERDCHLEIVKLLLKADSTICYSVDGDKMSPLHIAAEKGHVRMVEELLSWRPDCIEMVDKDGKNALHLAVENDEYKVAKYLIAKKKKRALEFINDGDNEGNTALHLATMKDLLEMVRLLLDQPKINRNATNKEGLTALDIAQIKGGHTFPQVSVWKALTTAGCTHGRRSPAHHDGKEELQHQTSRANDYADEAFKTMANTLSLVAALIATVTFAAAFTVPGGTHESKLEGAEEGTAVLINHFVFKVFVIADTVAMCSSMIVALILIWAVPGVPGMLSGAVGCSLRILWVALLGMVVTFITAIYLVVAPKCLWLAIIVCVMGSSTPFIASPLVLLSAKRDAHKAHFQYDQPVF